MKIHEKFKSDHFLCWLADASIRGCQMADLPRDESGKPLRDKHGDFFMVGWTSGNTSEAEDHQEMSRRVKLFRKILLNLEMGAMGEGTYPE